MFRSPINNLDLASDLAIEFFPNITGDHYNGDVTFLATLRALFINNPIPDERLKLSVVEFSSLGISTDTSLAEVAMEIGDVNSENNLIIVSLSEDEYAEMITSASRDGFVEDDRPAIKFESLLPFSIFYNQEAKTGMALFPRLDLAKYHVIQSILPRMMPWMFTWFNRESPEVELLMSLTKNTSDVYVSIITGIAEKFDFRSLKIKANIKDFETGYEDEMIAKKRFEIDSYNNSIEEYSSSIAEYLRKIDDSRTMIYGLEYRKEHYNEGESEIVQFLLKSKQHYIQEITSEKIDIICMTKLHIHNPDLFERAVSNRSSYMYGYDYGGWDKADIKTFFTALLEGKFDINIMAAFTIKRTGATEGRLTEGTLPPSAANYVNNPHIHRTPPCLGGYAPMLNEAARNRDIISALEIILESTKTINWNDSPAANFFKSLSNGAATCKYIEMDGELMTPNEALSALKDKKPKKKATKKKESEETPDA